MDTLPDYLKMGGRPGGLVHAPPRLKRQDGRRQLTETIRVFVAIELPEVVRAALGVAVAEIGASGARGVRPVKPEGIHLTLKFLGDIEPGQVGPLTEAIERAARTVAPFSLRLGDTGVFPGPGVSGPPRVLWVGVAGQLQPLRELWTALEAATSDLGFARDRQGFSPHLTLARIRDGTPSGDREMAVAALSRIQFADDLRIPVDSMGLIRSTLGPEGASYDRMASARLIG